MKASSWLVGTAIVLVAFGIVWVIATAQAGNALFGAVILGVGVVVGVVGWAFSLKRASHR